jgi:NUDIX domain
MTSGVSPLLPPDQYIASLARKRMAAGALFRDEGGRVLLVDPTYKPAWDLPGRAVEKEESPQAACRRDRMTKDLLRADRRRSLPGLQVFAHRIGVPYTWPQGPRPVPLAADASRGSDGLAELGK